MNRLYQKVKPDRVVQLTEGVEMEFRFIRGGTFLQGRGKSKRDKPIKKVTVPDFYMGIYPVTNHQFAAFLNDYGQERVKFLPYAGQEMLYEYRWGVKRKASRWVAEPIFYNHPMVFVNWYGAHTFCRWISKKTDFEFRLPSESEWEFAARGGRLSKNFPFAGSNRLDEVGWYKQNAHGYIEEVGKKLPNELGLLDMSGNVSEWCLDDWHEGYKDTPIDGSAWIEKNARNNQPVKILRGGGFKHPEYLCFTSFRDAGNAKERSESIGFRVASSLL